MIKILHYIGIAMTVTAGKGMFDIWKDRIENPLITEKQLLIGYTYEKFLKKPIIVDMGKTPHLFVCGLSGNGKTRMIEYAIKDKPVIILNAMKKDFRSCRKARRISDKGKICEFLTHIIDNLYMRERPLYIVIDELLVLCMDSKIQAKIMELLATGRHFNIYIIGISQIGTKEAVKFKDLFNARVCFRQVEESSYRTVLGFSPENTELQQREFHLYSDQIIFGHTYDIRPDEK